MSIISDEMKGQVSFEYLLTTLVSLVVLLGVMGALSYFSGSVGRLSDRAVFLSDSHNIYDNVYEVCILGDGNSRITHVRERLNISSSNGCIIIKDEKNNTFKKSIGCSIDETSFIGKVVVYNDGGRIFFNELE